MSKPFSVAFKQKMVERLTGKNAVSAVQLSRETGVRQQNAPARHAALVVLQIVPVSLAAGGA